MSTKNKDTLIETLSSWITEIGEIAQLQESKQYFLERASSITVPVDHIKVQTNTTADMVGNGVTNARSLDEIVFSCLYGRNGRVESLPLTDTWYING